MLSPILLAAWLATGLLAGTDPAAHRGIYGWGLGVELPVVGPLGDVPSGNQASWGHTLGVGVSYAITPAWLGRLQLAQTQTTGGANYLDFASGAERGRLAEMAAWSAWLVSTGGAYAWLVESVGFIVPYAGADFVWGYGGYRYHYGPDANSLLASPPTESVLSPPLPHTGLGWLLGAGVRGGVRLEVLPGLATVSELGLVWLPVSGIAVSNNREIRDVRLATQTVLLPYFSFGLRVQL